MKELKNSIDEIILALSTTMEGKQLIFIYKKIMNYNIKITTMSRGISIGDELEYTDEITLEDHLLTGNYSKQHLKMTLSIIIVNYNVRYFLEQCLYSVQLSSKKIKTEVFIVDNNSVDGSVEMIESKFPKYKLIKNKKMLVFPEPITKR